jgi:hypothetical protein
MVPEGVENRRAWSFDAGGRREVLRSTCGPRRRRLLAYIAVVSRRFETGTVLPNVSTDVCKISSPHRQEIISLAPSSKLSVLVGKLNF